MRIAALLLPLSLSIAMSTGVQARDSVPAEARIHPWSGAVPACEDPAVLAKIGARFAHRESKFWASGLRIVGYDRIRPVAYRAWGSEFIPRRYCTGVAHVQEGPVVRERRVNYVIGEDLGSAGYGWGLRWCVSGLDRHRSYAPDCRMILP